MKDFNNKIALVTGASRGAGRGIAIELAKAGYFVYITGRSRTGTSITQYNDLTLDETLRMIKEVGDGALKECDHSNELAIKAVFDDILKEKGRLDLLVNNVWAGYTDADFKLDIITDDFTAKFWEQPLYRWDHMFQISLRSHFISSQEATKIMLKQNSGLIITTGFWDDDKYLHQVPYDMVKHAKARMTLGMAIDLVDTNITAIYLSMGWIRTEHLKRMTSIALDDYNYRKFDGYEDTESTHFVGRAVVALASDKKIKEKSGKIVTTGEAADEYGFTDLDGSQPKRFTIPDESNGISSR